MVQTHGLSWTLFCKREKAAYAGYGFFAHKGNCRFCKERRKKELQELVTKLKEM